MTAGQGQPSLRPTNISTQNDPFPLGHVIHLASEEADSLGVPPLSAKPPEPSAPPKRQEDRTEHTADIATGRMWDPCQPSPPKDTKLPVASLLLPLFSASPDLPSQHLSVSVR